jgi:hypothetical protein
MFYKDNCLSPSWIGFYDDFGISLLSSVPGGHPSVLHPIPLPDDSLAHMSKFYDHLSVSAQNWWSDFRSDQFRFNAYNMNVEDFWLENADPVLPQPLVLSQAPLDPTLRHSVISVASHPLVSADQISKDAYLIFHNTSSNTWAFGVLKKHLVGGRISVWVYPVSESKPDFAISKRGLLSVTFEQIICHTFFLTKQGCLRKVTFRAIDVYYALHKY